MLLLILVTILLSPNTQTNSPNKSSLWAYKVSRAGASQFEDLFSISMSQIQLPIFTIMTPGENKQIHLCSKVLNFWTVMNFVGPNSGGVKGEWYGKRMNWKRLWKTNFNIKGGEEAKRMG